MPTRAPHRRALALALVVAVLALLVPGSLAANLLAVDYGTDSFKASLVKPGVPFDVLLTKEGRRKTPALVSFRGDERFVGNDAQAIEHNALQSIETMLTMPLPQSTRFPQDTLPSAKLLVGHSPAHPQSQLHASLFDLPQTSTARNSPAVTLGTGSKRANVPVEEALAFQLVYAKELAEEQANEPVRDAVITVPGWWAEKERRSMMDAAEIAGLRVVGLVNDGAAVAVNYAMARTFPPEPSYHLIYDLGSGSLRVSLVSLKSAMLPDPLSLSETPQLKNVTSITVHGFAHDLDVGGYVFDRIVRDLLVEAFDETTGKQLEAGRKVTDDKRAMAKLFKEAARVKQVLSANTAASARIEGLVDDLDFRTEVTREALEARAASLASHLTSPIASALSSAALDLSSIESVILVGGSSRVPLVQRAVAHAVGEDKIAKNVNADEAAVLGAALYGAGVTRGFRTKDIRVQDLTPFGIDVAYEAEKGSSDADPRIITTHLFPAFSKTASRKTLTLRKTRDFSLDFSYRPATADSASLPHAPTGHLLSTRVGGLTRATANLTAEQLANATVRVGIELDASGLVKVGRATLVLREEGDEDGAAKGGAGKGGVADKLKGLFNRFSAANAGKNETTGAAGGDEAGEGADAEALKEKEALSDEEKAELDRLLAEAQLPPAQTRLETEIVAGGEGGGAGMPSEEKSEIKKRLREAKSALTRKLAREEARNLLEAYVYRVRDLVDGGSRESDAFVAASTESERRAVKELQIKTDEWLWEESEQAETKALREKKRELEKLVQHILSRSTEALQRPALIADLRSAVLAASTFVSSARANATALASSDPGAPARFTDDELAKLEGLARETGAWVDDMVKKQDKVAAHEDAVLRVAELEKKLKEVERETDKLAKKKAPRRRKTAASASASAQAAEETPAAGKEHKKDEL
ncbi:hypothetical protein Rhopal_006837-T1 [Rhodotorula paludigena]|uniref:Uncharacterized protein n=1 Tax=Rhodotorula paludigena TaxID=86838 RepID=A0AAV5GV12_9BASI|nr:hypothetical protein Rhopal_006837-T1 [Rhodotorula paludigena]